MGQTERLIADVPIADACDEVGIDNWLALLANADRRAIVSHLASVADTQGASISEIELAVGISRFSVSRHLQLMREAGLIEMEKQGTRVFASLTPEPMLRIDDWVWGIVEAVERRTGTP